MIVFYLYVCLSVCLSVCSSLCFHDNSWTIRHRMMKLGTIMVEVKSDLEFEDGSRTWPLTRPNWRVYMMYIQRMHIKLQAVHMYILTIPVEYLVICGRGVDSQDDRLFVHSCNGRWKGLCRYTERSRMEMKRISNHNRRWDHEMEWGQSEWRNGMEWERPLSLI